jgi:hypothetical protein
VSEIHLAEVERDSLPDELDFYETRVADKVLRDAVESIWQSWCWFIALIETTKSEKKNFRNEFGFRRARNERRDCRRQTAS